MFPESYLMARGGLVQFDDYTGAYTMGLIVVALVFFLIGATMSAK